MRCVCVCVLGGGAGGGKITKLAKNRENDNDVTISRHDVNINFFDAILLLFLLSSLVTGPSFM